jgi:hypothetical protein
MYETELEVNQGTRLTDSEGGEIVNRTKTNDRLGYGFLGNETKAKSSGRVVGSDTCREVVVAWPQV